MKKIYIFLAALFFAGNLLAAHQNVFTIKYIGSDMQFIKADLDSGIQTVISMLDSSKINDYNSEAVAYDYVNKKVILAGWHGSEDRIYSIDVNTGAIVYYAPGYQATELEFAGGFAYTMHNVSSQIELRKVNITAGTQSLVATLDSSIISDINPEASSFDYSNNRIVVAGWHGGVSKIFAIDITDGSIDQNYAISFDPNDMEFGNGKAYCFRYSSGLYKLYSVDLGMSTETFVADLDSNVFNDFNPSSTSYDKVNNRLVMAGWNSVGSDRIFSLNPTTGAVVVNYGIGFGSAMAETDSMTVEAPIPSGLNSQELFSKVQIFPNPSSGTINIIIDGIEKRMDVYNSFGQLIREIEFGDFSENQIDLSELSNGIYFFRIFSEAGVLLQEQKVILQK